MFKSICISILLTGTAFSSFCQDLEKLNKKELREFLESLPQEAFIKIRKFFETMPILKHEIEVTNPKTNVKSKVVLTGISDFFE